MGRPSRRSMRRRVCQRGSRGVGRLAGPAAVLHDPAPPPGRGCRLPAQVVEAVGDDDRRCGRPAAGRRRARSAAPSPGRAATTPRRGSPARDRAGRPGRRPAAGPRRRRGRPRRRRARVSSPRGRASNQGERPRSAGAARMRVGDRRIEEGQVVAHGGLEQLHILGDQADRWPVVRARGRSRTSTPPSRTVPAAGS